MTRIGSVLTSLAVSTCLVACSQKTDTPFNTLLEQARAATASGDLKNARAKLNEVITMSEKAEDDLATVRALNDLAEIEKKEDHAEKLRSLYDKAGKICDDHVRMSDSSMNVSESWLKEAVRTFSGLGLAYSNLGSFTTAQSYFEKAIDYEERIDMPADQRKARQDYDQLLKKTLQEKHDVDIANKNAFARAERRKAIENQIKQYNKESQNRQPAQNLKILEAIYAKSRQDLDVQDFAYGRSRELLFAAYFDAGKYAQARALLEKDLGIYRQDEESYLTGKKIDGETILRVERLERQLAQISPCYLKEQRYEKAKEVVDRRVKMLERLQLPQWNRLAFAYSEKSDLSARFGKLSDAIEYSLKTIQLLKRDPELYSVHLRERYRVLSDYFALADKPKESAEAAKRFLSYVGKQKLFPFEIRPLLNAASCLFKHEQYKDAVLLSERAANAALQLDPTTEESTMFDIVVEAADTCRKSNDCKAAEAILERSLKTVQSFKEKSRLAAVYEHIGETRSHCKDWKNAIPAYKQAIAVLNAIRPKDAGFAGINNKLAGCYVALNRLDQSIAFYKESAAVCRKSKNKEPYQSTSLQLAEPLRLLHRYAEAREACLEAAKYPQPASNDSMRYAISGYCTAVGHSLSLNLREQAMTDYANAKAFYEKHKTQLNKANPEHVFWLATDAKYLHRYDESLGYFQICYGLIKEKGDSALLARCLAQLAFVLQKTGAAEKSKEYKSQCEAMRVRLKLNVDQVYENEQ